MIIKTLLTERLRRKAEGAPCGPGETAAQTGCKPAEGGGGKEVSGHPPVDEHATGGPVRNLPVFRGGPAHEGKLVTYHSTNRDFAQSYVDMYNERFGGGGALREETITIEHPAPESSVQREAEKLGMDYGDYAPASVFDTNLFQEGDVKELINRLRKQGYDGAVLPDIPYGKEIEGEAYITFTSAGKPPATPTKPARPATPIPAAKPTAPKPGRGAGTPQQRSRLRNLKRDLAQIEEAARRGYSIDRTAPDRYRRMIQELEEEMR